MASVDASADAAAETRMTFFLTSAGSGNGADLGGLAGADQRMRDLVFFDLLEDGFYTARRGLMALSLPIGDAECDALVAAVARRAPRWAALLGKD